MTAKKPYLALFGVMLFWATPLAAQNSDMRSVHINGEASILVRPDMAQISIGVTTEGSDPLSTLDANSAAIRKVIDFAQKSGVDRDDMATQSVNLAPRFKSKRQPDGSSSSEQVGYTASNTIRVDLKDLHKLGSFSRQVLELGANRIQGVTFALASPQAIRDQARIEALKDARRKADLLAEAAGAKVGKIMRIAHPPREEVRRSDDGAADMPQKSVPKANIPIEVGLIAVRAEVDAIWLLE